MGISDRTCPTCHKICATKANLKTHINRKKGCEYVDNNEINVTLQKKNKCTRCNCEFQTLQNLNLHMNKKKKCIIKIDAILTVEQLSQELKEQKMLIDQLQSKNQVTNNTTNNNNNTINNNHIHLHMSGSEDLSHITKEQWMHCFKLNHQSIEALFQLKYFSKLKPENHNLYISNLDTKHINVLNSKGWETKGRKPVIYKLYYKAKDNLRDTFESMFFLEDGTVILNENLTENQRADQRNIIKMFSQFVFDDMDDTLEEQVRKTSCDAMEYHTFNNRRPPMKIQKEMEKNIV